MVINEAELRLFFTNGIASITKLNKLRVEREAFREGLEILPKGKPYVIVKQIDDEMIKRVRQSMKEVTPEFPALMALLTQEMNAWTGLKAEISESGVTSRAVAYLRQLQRILYDQKTLVPEKTDEKSLNLFLTTMRKAIKMAKR